VLDRRAAEAALVAPLPAAAVDEEDERRRLLRFRLPEIEHLPFVTAVRQVRGRRRGPRWGRFLLLLCPEGWGAKTYEGKKCQCQRFMMRSPAKGVARVVCRLM